MRDPKAHAKVLELRRDAVREAAVEAFANDDRMRQHRLYDLADRIGDVALDESGTVEWRYYTWTVPPHWRRTEIIPDTEERS